MRLEKADPVSSLIVDFLISKSLHCLYFINFPLYV
jgi:hypothetical protein